MTKIAINGFGRIGRAFLKEVLKQDNIEVVAINDLADLENLAYLLKYDSAYGKAHFDIEVKKGMLVASGHEIAYFSEKDPALLPWKKLGVDIVVESTGFFASAEKARIHINAGAKRVVVSAPFEGGDSAARDTILMGINEHDLAPHDITSNASCTTNAASTPIAVLHKKLGVEKAILSTVHAYTATQRLVDSPDAKDWRRGRAGAVSIVPSTTGAAIAVTKAIPDLAGKFDGISLRVPTLTGSLADITFISSKPTSVEEVNKILSDAAMTPELAGILGVTNEELVSADIVGNTHAAIVDLAFTKVVGGNLVKILAWYDNEAGYASTLVRHVQNAAAYI